jgi:rhomboid protease GluP
LSKRGIQSLFRRNSLSGHSLVHTLIYLNLGLFTLMVLHGTILGLQMQAIFNPPTQLLLHWGAQFWPLVVQHNQWWRCITYAYTHGGLMHIGFNMLVLYQIGPMIEAEIGWRRFFTLYTLCGFLATVAGYFWHPMVTVVGASGAIFGLIGFSISYYHRIGGALAIQHRNFMVQWAVMAFVFGLVVGADNAAHLGGLATGLGFGWLVPTSIRGQRDSENLFKILGWACVGLSALSILAIPFSWF